MKKLLSALLVFAVLFTGSNASALSGKDREQNKQDREAKRVESKEKRDKRNEKLSIMFNKFNPNGSSEFDANAAEHTAFHDQRKATKDSYRSSQREQFDKLKASLENGEITQEQYNERKEALKAAIESYRKEAKAIIENKKVELKSVRDQSKAIREEFKTMRESGSIDETRMAELLDTVNELAAQHLEIDYKYAALIDALR